MARYIASTALNLRWRGVELAHIETLGRDSGQETILAPGRRVTPIEPGEPFEIPDHLSAEFEATFGPSRGNANVSADAREAGRIAGLQRLD